MVERRYITGAAPTNEMRLNNIGDLVELDGERPNDSGKLCQVDDDSPINVPWLLAISTKIVAGPSSILGPVVRGKFGSGSIMHTFECDAAPDSVVTLPGATADADVVWDQIIKATSNGGFAPDTISRYTSAGGTNFLPASAKIRGSVKHGSPTAPNATRSLWIDATGAGVHAIVLDMPAFSSEFMLYFPTDAGYATVNMISFISSFGGTVVQVLPANLLAMKNAGALFPIPGNASKILVQAGAAVGSPFQLGFSLNI